METVLIATIFTEARSCIAATSKWEGTPISIGKTVMICQATSSPVILFARSINLPTFCLICQLLVTYRNTTTIASHTWVVPSCKHYWEVFAIFIKAISSRWRIKGISCLRWVEIDREYPCSSSKSLKLSILLSGTPAFSIAVTTFTQ